MQEIHAGSATFYTADVIGNALVRCAEALSSASQTATVEIPVMSDHQTRTVRISLGPKFTIRSAHSPGWSVDRGSTEEVRDEFGSPATDGCPMISLMGRAAVDRAARYLDALAVAALVSTDPTEKT
jgi:hypothetical protein